MLPQDKCWVFKENVPIANKPLYGLNNKITCVNYCIYHDKGKETCPMWKGTPQGKTMSLCILTTEELRAIKDDIGDGSGWVVVDKREKEDK